MQITEWLGHGLIYFFTEIPLIGDAMAAFLAIVLIGTAFVIAYHYKRKYHSPLASAIKARIRMLDEITDGGTADVDEVRLKFARRFNDIDAQMMEADTFVARPLRRTWEEYRETIVDPSAEVLQNSARPEHFFISLGDRQRGLNWFANIFIAIGLLITFLGIIAALSTLDFSGDTAAMQGKLNSLMKVAGAKFWASVGGILASIILRSFDYRFGKRINDGLSMLCDKLEHGMAYLPPQRIASDQLAQLKEQTPALRTFSEQLAAALDGALEKQMAPMITHLGSIQQGIDKISGGGGEAVRDAIASGAGAEMAGLADAIGVMTASMAVMSERLEKQTGEADRQIEEAIKRFGQASEEMRSAFGELNRNFGVVADRMREENEQASELARARMDELLSNLGNTLDDMKSGLASAASQMGEASARAANDAARIGQEAMEKSFSEFVERFNQIGAPLVGSMKDAGSAISTSADRLSSAQSAIGDHTRAIEQVAARSNDLATAFRTVAHDAEAATVPVRQSAVSIAEAVKSVELIISRNADSSENARDEMRQMATALNDTASSASSAWSEYRARFENVDRALGEAIDKISDAAGNHASNLNERVGQIDRALGDGVAQLAGALEPLTTLRDTVEELAEILARQNQEAAE
ncbi:MULTISPECIES: anti-phage ZorAB system protein ZorA [unclassified Iodidimonas]|uniref:anti-phage ZorAB system protein ZorA n=1 Tax=unclassified Iodidimonas TaxID=2626145 RepID=UPI002482513F|nr:MULTISPECIES: anti-phage ZorAB system protein ZorA [unclassified Iodidimonas]